MELDSLDNSDGAEDTGVGFVEISKTSASQEALIFRRESLQIIDERFDKPLEMAMLCKSW